MRRRPTSSTPSPGPRLALALLLAATAFACRTNRLRHLDFAAISDIQWQRLQEGGQGPPSRHAAPTPRAETPPPKQAKREPVPVVAVFDIENKGAKLNADTMARLSDYLSARLAATGRYQVIPRDQLKQRLTEQKKSSYRECYAQSCQIEIGKEMAAQKSLSTQLVRLGSQCMVTAVFYDLRTSASEGGASSEGACQEDDVVKLIQGVIVQLTAKAR